MKGIVKMKKVLMIGIDGLDPVLLSKLEYRLPNFRRLIKEGQKIKYQSIYPYDSMPIWSSIYTGLTPARHGILDSVNHQKKDDLDINANILSKKTFWDFASEAGKNVCIVNPFVAYPPWPVNGVMVSGPISTTGDPDAFPKEILNSYKIPHLGGIHEGYLLKKDLTEFYKRSEKISLDEADFGLRILKDHKWDLAFLCFTTLDGVEHFFWRYFDESDPTHPKKNPFKNVILEFYKLFDKIIGKFLTLNPDVVIVFSDHGFGMRSVKLVNTNEFLRKQGFLACIAKSKSDPFNIIEKMKPRVFDFVYDHDLEDLALQLSRLAPNVSKNLQSSLFNIDFDQSMAYTSDLIGMNPCGGIKIVKKNIGVLDYEEVRSFIIKKISKIKDPATGKRLIKWICKREDLYCGDYISEYPDILFELEDGYGINWNTQTPLISNSYSHKLISGGHKREATFIIWGLHKKVDRDSLTSVDIAPTILDLINVKGNFNFDGTSILK